MLYLILLLPFLLGIGCAFCKEENARRLTPVLAAAQTVLTALVIYAAVSGKDWATNVVYLSESLTFSLKMDGVAAVFAVVTAVCWLLTIPYAAVYMPHSGGEPRFYVFLFTTEAVLLGTALAADYVGRLEQAGTTTVTANGTKDSVTFKLYGQINRGWQVGDSFKITPTFTVSATKPA